ncbi:hypothetical protein [Xanthobacter dioxanivorans]|uniref:hypothetical protein n=1 Tax=Xanthobacter dioxanivorans TaxID=2528964 RepID=UPI0038CD143D
MQHLGDVSAVEDALLRRQQVEHDLRPVQDSPAVFGALLFEQLQPFEIDWLALVRRLRWIALAPTPICVVGTRSMRARRRNAVDADLQAGERQMLVLQVEPAVALLQELGLLARPER